MNNLSKEKKQQFTFVILIAAVVLSVIWFFLISPQQKERENIRNRTADIESKISKADKLKKREHEIAQELNDNQASLQAIESNMVGADPFFWFLSLMNKYASSRSLNFQASNISQPGDMALLPKFPYRAITFGATMSASYKDFGRFVADFENDWPYLRVQNVNLRSAGNSESGSTPASGKDEKLEVSFEVVGLVATNRATANR